MDKIFIITGANGHLGNTIVRQLVNDNMKVRVLLLENDNVKSLDGVDCDIYYGNVCDKSSLNEIFDIPCDCVGIVIHCAGIVSIASKFIQNVYDVNVNGTKNVVDFCISKNVSKLIYVSSVHAIPEKLNGESITEISQFAIDKVEGLYAKTKAEATQYVLDMCKHGLNACVVHPSGIIGPNDHGRGHLTQLVIDYLNGTLTACINGGYDFVDVRDVSNGILNAVDYGRCGECYILSNQYYELIDFLAILSKLSGKKQIKTILPTWFANLTAPLAELYYKIIRQPPLYTRYSLFTVNSNSRFCNEKAKTELNYTTLPIQQTLKDTIDFLVKTKRIERYKNNN